MKIGFVAGMLLPLIISSSSPGRQAEEDIALIESYVKAVENLDYQAMESYLADAYTGFGPSYGDSIDKEGAMENWRYNVEHLYEEIDYRRSRNVAVTVSSGENRGEWVSNWAELHIRYRNGAGEVTIMANTIYRIEGGKIIRSFTFYNEADALRQLGYTFLAPERSSY